MAQVVSNLPSHQQEQQAPLIQIETSKALNYSNTVHYAGKFNDKYVKQSSIENVGALAAGTAETTATFRFASDIYNLYKSYLQFDLASAAGGANIRYFYRNDCAPISWIRITCDQLEQKIDNFSHYYKMVNGVLTKVSDLQSRDTSVFPIAGMSKTEFFDPANLSAMYLTYADTVETEAKAAPFLVNLNLNQKCRSTSSTLDQIGGCIVDPLVLHYTPSFVNTAHSLRCTIPFKNILDTVFAMNKYVRFPNNVEITVGFHGISNIGETQTATDETKVATSQDDFAQHVVNSVAITVSNLKCVLCRAQDPQTRQTADAIYEAGLALPCPYVQVLKSTAANAAASAFSDSRVITQSLASRLLRVYSSIFISGDTGITHAKNSNYGNLLWSQLRVALGNNELDFTESDMVDMHRQLKSFYDGSVSGNYGSWVVNPVILSNLSGEDHSYEIKENMHKVSGMPIDGSLDHVLSFTNVAANAKNLVRVLVGQRMLYVGKGGMKLV